MSMAIDLSKPLTTEEREFLAARGRYAELERADAMHGVTGQELPSGDGTAPVQHGTATYDQRDAKIAELEAQLALLRGPGADSPGEVEEDDSEELEPYETWEPAELKAEIDRRNVSRSEKISKAGSKQDLADRLYADDAS